MCVFDPPPSGSPPTEPMSEPNLIPAMAGALLDLRLFEGLPPTPPPAVRWLMETNQGTCEEMVRPETQVVDMTLEDTVMLGAIKKEVNGSHYSLQRDDDGNHLPHHHHHHHRPSHRCHHHNDNHHHRHVHPHSHPHTHPHSHPHQYCFKLLPLRFLQVDGYRLSHEQRDCGDGYEESEAEEQQTATQASWQLPKCHAPFNCWFQVGTGVLFWGPPTGAK